MKKLFWVLLLIPILLQAQSQTIKFWDKSGSDFVPAIVAKFVDETGATYYAPLPIEIFGSSGTSISDNLLAHLDSVASAIVNGEMQTNLSGATINATIETINKVDSLGTQAGQVLSDAKDKDYPVSAEYRQYASFNGVDNYIMLDATGTVRGVSMYINPSTNSELINISDNTYIEILGDTVKATGFDSVFVNNVYTTSINYDEWSHLYVKSNTDITLNVPRFGLIDGTYYEGELALLRLDNVGYLQNDRTELYDKLNAGDWRLLPTYSYATSNEALPAWGSNNIDIKDLNLTTQDVDQFLIDLANAGGSSGTLDISGNNAARSSASDNAKSTLIGNSWTITVNE